MTLVMLQNQAKRGPPAWTEEIGVLETAGLTGLTRMILMAVGLIKV